MPTYFFLVVRRNKSKLTCAGLHALEPRVVELGVARISTIVEPSTAGSATAGFAGFLFEAALGTRGNVNHRSDRFC